MIGLLNRSFKFGLALVDHCNQMRIAINIVNSSICFGLKNLSLEGLVFYCMLESLNCDIIARN